MRFVIIGLMISSCLTACCQDNFDYQKITQPDLVAYASEVQEAAVIEMRTQNVPVLTEFMKDYKVMRDQVRVAKGMNICPHPAGLTVCK